MRPVILIAALFCTTSARAETDPRKLFGKEDPDAPITPGDVPLYASADGSRVGLAAASKKKGCDPEDQYGEGRCDFEVTFEVRDAAGKAVEKLKFVLGNFKQKSDVAKLSERITALGLLRGQPVEMGDRLYTFAGGKKLVIDAAGKKVRMRVLAADDKVLDERTLPAQCPGKGAKTIWGADAYWVEAAGRLLVLPRACKKPSLQVVTVPR